MWEDDFYWYWLCSEKNTDIFKIRRILEKYGNAAYVFKSFKPGSVSGLTERDEKYLTDKCVTKIYEDFLRMKDSGVSFVHIKHKDYPERLKSIYDPPAALYVIGSLPADDKLSVAIVGARECSQYGKAAAYNLASELSARGVQVISGLAMGIDASAHKGSLDREGYTCAVMGCGVDVCYPKFNMTLYKRIAQSGALISEYPIHTPPLAYHFPKRNRIISGLANAVIIVEAKKKSGSLITADCALEQGRDVFAVPGRMGDVLSEGCNKLIKDGAQLLTCADDIFDINLLNSPNYHTQNTFKTQCENISDINMLASQKDIVYSCLGLSPKSLDEVLEETKLDVSVVSEAILYLQIEGKISEMSKNCYAKLHL